MTVEILASIFTLNAPSSINTLKNIFYIPWKTMFIYASDKSRKFWLTKILTFATALFWRILSKEKWMRFLISASIYLFKDNNEKNASMYWMWWYLAVKARERRHLMPLWDLHCWLSVSIILCGTRNCLMERLFVIPETILC